MTVATYEAATDLAPMQHVGQTDPTGGRLVAWAESLSAAHQLASALCRTSFVPKHFAGKPEEAAAALMLGDELGFSPVSALRSIFVISGTPGLYARSMVALVQSHGHQVWTETDSPTKVTVCGQRAGSDKVERSEWTIDRARRAGYTNNKKYESDPQAMLYARAASDVCRRIAADVLSGVPHTVEEMELEAAQAPAKTVKRTAVKPVPAEPDLPAVGAPKTDGGASGPVTAPDPVRSAPTEQPAPSSPEPITPAQIKMMAASMGELGMTDRDSALAFVADVIGHPVESRNDLTKAEATKVIDALQRDLAGTPEEPELDGAA